MSEALGARMSPGETPHTVRDTLGRALRDLRISVTDRCNFRCEYCMPRNVFGLDYNFLPRAQLLTFEEIERIARIAVGFGVHKIRLTGGEPLVRNDLERLVEALARIRGVDDLALTTNGFLLTERRAKRLRSAGLRRATVSLDSLDADTFARMNGAGVRPERILAAIAAAQHAGLHPVKVNAVVKRGVNDGSIVDLAAHFRGTGVVVRFIEYMDVGTQNGWRIDDVVPAREIVDRISAVWPLEPVAAQADGEVARRYRYSDGHGEIGIIASVTMPFCGACTRARLSPEGLLFTCLFAPTGLDLRSPLRTGASDSSLAELITGRWQSRSDRYSEERASQPTGGPIERMEMFRIGG